MRIGDSGDVRVGAGLSVEVAVGVGVGLGVEVAVGGGVGLGAEVAVGGGGGLGAEVAVGGACGVEAGSGGASPQAPKTKANAAARASAFIPCSQPPPSQPSRTSVQTATGRGVAAAFVALPPSQRETPWLHRRLACGRRGRPGPYQLTRKLHKNSSTSHTRNTNFSVVSLSRTFFVPVPQRKTDPLA